MAWEVAWGFGWAVTAVVPWEVAWGLAWSVAWDLAVVALDPAAVFAASPRPGSPRLASATAHPL